MNATWEIHGVAGERKMENSGEGGRTKREEVEEMMKRRNNEPVVNPPDHEKDSRDANGRVASTRLRSVACGGNLTVWHTV